MKIQRKEICLLSIASFFSLIHQHVRRMMDRIKWIRDVFRVIGVAQVYFPYNTSKALSHI